MCLLTKSILFSRMRIPWAQLTVHSAVVGNFKWLSIYYDILISCHFGGESTDKPCYSEVHLELVESCLFYPAGIGYVPSSCLLEGTAGVFQSFSVFGLSCVDSGVVLI